MSELDERLMDAEELGLPTRAFAKQDGGEDMEVYGSARFVFHIDDTAIGALTSLYAELLPFGGPVLDLMSSWVSHLPVGLSLDEVVGHGMNTKELESNHDLDRFFVQDLNRVAALPERDGWFDAVLVCAGVQYLQRPLAVFARRGGFSARTAYWWSASRTAASRRRRRRSGADSTRRIRRGWYRYMQRSGFSGIDVRVLADGSAGDPLIAVIGRT